MLQLRSTYGTHKIQALLLVDTIHSGYNAGALFVHNWFPLKTFTKARLAPGTQVERYSGLQGRA